MNIAASPRNGINAITGEGLKEAVAGAQVVIDLANSPLWFGYEKIGIGDADPLWRRKLTLGKNNSVPLVKLTWP